MAALPSWSLLPLRVVPGGVRLLAPPARLGLPLRQGTALASRDIGVLDALSGRVGRDGWLTAYSLLRKWLMGCSLRL
jgi:hypothetical protein